MAITKGLTEVIAQGAIVEIAEDVVTPTYETVGYVLNGSKINAEPIMSEPLEDGAPKHLGFKWKIEVILAQFAATTFTTLEGFRNKKVIVRFTGERTLTYKGLTMSHGLAAEMDEEKLIKIPVTFERKSDTIAAVQTIA